MDGTACSVWLTVMLAVIIHRHPIDCILSVTVSTPMGIEECPETCACNSEKGSTVMTCSIAGKSGEDMNLDIETKFTHLISNVTYLSISKEPRMDSVPMIICEMQMLEVLDLSSNSIADLPIGCFTKLPYLRKLNLERNKISALKRGTIEGLQKLEELYFTLNGLVSIDPEIFSNRSDLKSLGYLDFSQNRINNVDAWIFIRAQAHPGCTVDLGFNSINNFTNNVGWSFRCGMPPLNIHLILKTNPLQRISCDFQTVCQKRNRYIVYVRQQWIQ